MSRELMDELYEELKQIGITFTELERQRAQTMIVGIEYYSVCGILRNADGDAFIMERMAEVFAIAEKKATFLVPKPGEKYGKATFAICFMQGGLFETAYSVYPVIGSLQRNFWYVQEDEAALELHALLERFAKSVQVFLKKQQSVHSFYSNSYMIQEIVMSSEALFRKEEIASYMDSDSCRGDVELLHGVLTCLRLAC